MPVATDSSLLQGTTRFPAHGTVGRRVEQAIEFLGINCACGRPEGPGSIQGVGCPSGPFGTSEPPWHPTQPRRDAITLLVALTSFIEKENKRNTKYT